MAATDWMKILVLAPVRVYRYLISPLIPPRCRFIPTCSCYAIEAVESHGLRRGVGLALRRLARCHPWGGSGFDPVPPRHGASCHFQLADR